MHVIAVCGHDYGHACRGSTTGVAVRTVLTVWRWTSLCCRSDNFQLSVLTAGMWGSFFLGPCTQVQGRVSCPQGHGPHN